MSWKTCGNCSKFGMLLMCGDREDCSMWLHIPCPNCGGSLSEVREHNEKRYRHCYACHFEFEENEKASP